MITTEKKSQNFLISGTSLRSLAFYWSVLELSNFTANQMSLTGDWFPRNKSVTASYSSSEHEYGTLYNLVELGI